MQPACWQVIDCWHGQALGDWQRVVDQVRSLQGKISLLVEHKVNWIPVTLAAWRRGNA
jgi:hypothetical protein